MRKPWLFIGLVLVAVAASGCAPYLMPYSGRYPGYARMRPSMVEVDPEAGARGRWDRVMRLPSGSTIELLTMDGRHAGTFSEADGFTLRMLVGGNEEQFSRTDVLRIDLLDLPGSEAAAVARRAARGALIGLGGAALIAGVIGAEVWPPPGILLRGGAAAGGVAGGQAALIEHRSRVIYLAEDLGAPIKRRPVPESSDPMADARLRNFVRETALDSARATMLAVLMKAFVGPAATPFLLAGPASPIGSVRSAVLDRQPWVAMPSPFGGPPPVLPQQIPAARSSRPGAAICQSETVRLSGRHRAIDDRRSAKSSGDRRSVYRHK